MLELEFWGYKDSEFRVQSFESGQTQTFTERPAPRQVDVPMAIYGNIPMITAVSRLEGLPWGGHGISILYLESYKVVQLLNQDSYRGGV